MATRGGGAVLWGVRVHRASAAVPAPRASSWPRLAGVPPCPSGGCRGSACQDPVDRRLSSSVSHCPFPCSPSAAPTLAVSPRGSVLLLSAPNLCTHGVVSPDERKFLTLTCRDSSVFLFVNRAFCVLLKKPFPDVPTFLSRIFYKPRSFSFTLRFLTLLELFSPGDRQTGIHFHFPVRTPRCFRHYFPPTRRVVPA